MASAAAASQPDADSSQDSESSDAEEERPGIFVQAFLRGSAASKSGLKPEIVPASEQLSDRVVVPPEGSALPEVGVYISNGKRVSLPSSRPFSIHRSRKKLLASASNMLCSVPPLMPCSGSLHSAVAASSE